MKFVMLLLLVVVVVVLGTVSKVYGQISEINDIETINKMFESRRDDVNQFLSSGVLFRQDIDLLGDKQNHLDPLNLNGAVKVDKSEDHCSEEHCVTVFGKKFCMPALCAGGMAKLSVDTVRGVSSLQIDSFRFSNLSFDEDLMMFGKGSIGIHLKTIRADSQIHLRMDLGTTHTPVDMSGYLEVTAPKLFMEAEVSASVSLEDEDSIVFQLKDVHMDQARIQFNEIVINFDNVPNGFNKAVTSLTNDVKSLLRRFMDVDGKISNALRDGINQSLKSQIGMLNDKLKQNPIKIPSSDVAIQF